MTPEPCTNWYRTRRHLSVDLAEDRPYGRSGRSLCWTESNPVEVYDQAWITEWARDRRRLGFATKDVVVVDLPECKKCAAKAAKLANATQKGG